MTHRSMVTAVLSVYSDWEWPSDTQLSRVDAGRQPRRGLTPLAYNDAGRLLLPDAGLRAGAILCRHREGGRIDRAGPDRDLCADRQCKAMRAEYDLSSIEMMAYDASPMSPDPLLGQNFVQFYGQTEAPLCVTAMRKSRWRSQQVAPVRMCGRPTPLSDVKLFDPQGRSASASPAICVGDGRLLETSLGDGRRIPRRWLASATWRSATRRVSFTSSTAPKT